MLTIIKNQKSLFSIGLLKTDRPFEFNQFVRPIPLVRRRILGNGLATVSGFGLTWLNRDWTNATAPETLQFLRLQTITNLECSIKSQLLGPLEPRYVTPIIYSGHICSQTPRGVGTCFGDSGSPLINRDGVIGVVVSGVLVCARGAPDIYIRVSTYFNWIDSYIWNLS